MLTEKEFNDLVHQTEFQLDLLYDLVLLATFGLKDRCRDKVDETTSEIQEDLKIKLWLVSGGHEQSTLHVAKKAGIADKNTKVKSGEELRQLLNQFMVHDDSYGWQFSSKEKRQEFFNVFVNSPSDDYNVICRADTHTKS
jgi:magnesium-transporting ATPase (P-type)